MPQALRPGNGSQAYLVPGLFLSRVSGTGDAWSEAPWISGSGGFLGVRRYQRGSACLSRHLLIFEEKKLWRPNLKIWVIEQAFGVLKDQKDQPLSVDAEDFLLESNFILAASPPVDLRANCFGLGTSPSAPTPKSTKAPCFVRTMFNGIWINPSLYLDSKSTINVILTQLAEDIWNSEARNYQQVKHVTYKS